MGRMVRKQIYIEPEQDALLKRRAAELGVTESEFIRRAISDTGQQPAATVTDDEAWEEELEFIEERARSLPATGGERGWTREDLYDRLDRFSR
jgi:hypothetical protein